MRDLILAGLAAIENNDPVVVNSCFRDVYPFDFNSKEYVIKVDRFPTLSNGCYSEASSWKYRSCDTLFRRWFAPVLASGLLSDPEREVHMNKRNWLIMPKLTLIREICGKSDWTCQVDFMMKNIAPDFIRDFPEAFDAGTRIALPKVSDDLHWENWGRTSKNQWQVIDYA